MKELNTFRKFITEGNAHDEVLSPLMTSDKTNLQEPIEQVLKTRDYIRVNKISGDYLAQVYNFDDYKNLNITPDDVKNALHKLDVVKITDGDKLASDYDLGGLGEYVLLNYNGNKYLAHDGGRYITALAEGNEIHEGTWGYGSKDQMIQALSMLEKIKKMGGVKGSLELDKIGSMLYNTFGNDDFHDSIDAAKDAATDDDQFANYIGDAQTKGIDMLNNIYSGKGGNAFSKAADNPDVRVKDAMSNDLSENDKALDEIINNNGTI